MWATQVPLASLERGMTVGLAVTRALRKIEEADARVAGFGGPGPGDSRGGRAVADDEQLEVGVALGEHRSDRIGKECRGACDRQQYGEAADAAGGAHDGSPARRRMAAIRSTVVRPSAADERGGGPPAM